MLEALLQELEFTSVNACPMYEYIVQYTHVVKQTSLIA